MKDILVPIAPGELIDKLTILQLKSENITDPVKLANVKHEYTVLKAVADAHIPASAKMTALWQKLYAINADLWVIEDDIRAFEGRGDFGAGFVALARAVYWSNQWLRILIVQRRRAAVRVLATRWPIRKGRLILSPLPKVLRK